MCARGCRAVLRAAEVRIFRILDARSAACAAPRRVMQDNYVWRMQCEQRIHVLETAFRSVVTAHLRRAPVDRREPVLKQHKTKSGGLKIYREHQLRPFSRGHGMEARFLRSARAMASSRRSSFFLVRLDGSPCIVSYISCTRAMTRCSMPAEISGKSWAACVSKRMKHAIASARVGGRCFFSIREMTSGLSHPKR